MDPSPASTPILKAPDEARKAVEELVQRFAANAHLYTGNSYNETQVRQEFINPFFEALGWDVSNKTGAYEAFKDVVHEDALKVGDSNRAPDYSFRFGGQRVYFVEAKKPAVAVKADVQPAFQLRRYAWSAGLPVSILTDFEEFAVYDTRQKPDRKDDAAVARALYVRYDQYLAELDRLYAIFSKEAVRTGGLHRFAADTRGKRGTTEVSSEFLKTIESWRDGLAREIALRNPDLADHELNHAVQATIDRILFLRIAEDRGIEPADTLHDLADKSDVYPALCDLFRRADERYNAGLFNFGSQGDQVCLNLQINDKPLHDILKGLYYPVCPYEFSVIPGDILGAVYEQFLGKVIRLTAGHRAKVEDKPEVRKAGGVYYTPRYIVDYIVEHTVGASLAQQKAPAKLTVLDPACGSGSFLLGAYEYLLDWHLKAYVAEDPDSFCRGKSAPLVKLGPGDYRLSLAERRRILTDCLFGVDLDPQAVEVTKLNLLLKCMEGENEQTLQPRLLGHERVLPNIDRNIKCGNSLIGWDYFEGQLMPEAAEIRRVRPFDWGSEFAEIMGSGGFDCVIGNPPYLSFSGRQKAAGYDRDLPYWARRYPLDAWPSAHGLFLVQSARLRRPGGYAAMIVPDQVGHLAGYGALRSQLLETCAVVEVRYWGEHVFEGVTTPALTVVLGDPNGRETTIVSRKGKPNCISPKGDAPWVASYHVGLITKLLKTGVSLGDSVKDPGVHTGNCSKVILSPPAARDSGRWEPILEGKQVSRYSCALATKSVRVDYTPRGEEYFRIRASEAYAGSAYVIRQTAAFPIVGPRTGAVYFRNSLLALYQWGQHADEYVVGLLNSSLIRFVYAQTTTEAGQKAFPQVKVGSLRSLPIRPIDFSNPADVDKHDRMVGLVQTMLDLHRRLPEAKTATDRDLIQRQIDATDRQIDALVYELYGVTEEEIAIVEGTAQGN